jgi:hypothetical protein
MHRHFFFAGISVSLSLVAGAHADQNLHIGGCWSSRDTVLVDQAGKAHSCQSGAYFHLTQGSSSFKMNIFSFQCNENAPLFAEAGPYGISGSSLVADHGVVGKISSDTLTIDATDPAYGPSVVDTFTWASRAGKPWFVERLTINGKTARVLQGSLTPVRCLE